jgi:hypothetical protein
MSPIRKEDKTRYPDNWKALSEQIRFKRAASQCECDGRCGKPHAARCEAIHGRRSPYTGSYVVLTVAHLDHTPENCAEENLVAMCQRCHLAYDRDHHAETAARTRKVRAAAAGGMLPLEMPDEGADLLARRHDSSDEGSAA